MFAIMDNRKRPRLEINTTSNTSNEDMQGVASTATTMSTATFATIGGQSFIISNPSTSSLPANILLSICEDNSNESEEYILDHSLLTPIKQEQTVSTQTTTNPNQLQQTPLVAAVPQYRIINQAGKPINATSLNSSSIISSNTLNANNSLHLPPGCEIYVIKEVFDSQNQIVAESNSTTSTGASIPAANVSAIKLESACPLPLPHHSSPNGCNTLTRNSNPTTINSTSTTSNVACSTTTVNDTAKRSLILEAYKKRDDKRRATHNEVERRRRDKINSWIFKLKEMLPPDPTSCNIANNLISKDNTTAAASLSMNQNVSTNRLLAQQQTSATTTTRTPPSDSKSQILIKACEYIKSMQEEISSLRECLTENESLRLENQHLQDEINNLRAQKNPQQKLHNNNHTNITNNSQSSNHTNDNLNNCEVTLNSLNATYANVQLFAPSTQNQNNNHHHLADLAGLTTKSNGAKRTPTSINVKYAKRNLIITDFVD